MAMKVIICGGRDYHDATAVMQRVARLPKDTIIIEGGARGADRLRAGPIRNRWMLALGPDLVIAFPGGQGTANMIAQARKAGVNVEETT